MHTPSNRPWFTIAATLTLCALTVATPGRASEPTSPTTLTRIAFGSCAKQDKSQPIWDTIVGQRPQLFLFIGDNIYADTEDPAVMRTKYAKLEKVPGFQRLREQCPVLATWDDHDFGVNDGGVEYPMKAEAQRQFNDFFRVPAASPRRKRHGVYGSQVFGPAGKRVQIILLDTRYFRSPLRTGSLSRIERVQRRVGKYVPHDDTSMTLLGEAQWKWLADQLRKPADVRIIASSIQFASGEHGWETWGNFPHERDRFVRLITETGASGIVMISGDRHLGALARYATADTPYPLYDLTSSGLNCGGGGHADEPNRYAVGPIFQGDNFGMIHIDWTLPTPRIRLSIRDMSGKPAINTTVSLDDLRAKRPAKVGQ